MARGFFLALGPLLSALALFTVSPAMAAPVQLWFGFAIDTIDADGEWSDFTLSTSETAYITTPAAEIGRKHFFTSDGANVTALFADMTNGVNNPLRWLSRDFDYTMDENRFFTAIPSDRPLLGWSPPPLGLPGHIDLAGFTIDHITVEGSGDEFQGVREQHYNVTVYAVAPEPGGLLLFGIGLALVHVSPQIPSCRFRPRSR